MSKVAKQGILLLIVLLFGVVGYAGFTFIKKQEVEKAYQLLEQELNQSRERENKNIAEISGLQDNLKKVESEKSGLLTKVQELERRSKDLVEQVNAAASERDKVKKRVDDLAKERDQLMAKVNDLDTQLAESKKQSESTPGNQSVSAQFTSDIDESELVDIPIGSEDQWAVVLKEKASLEVKLNDLTKELSEKSVEVLNLKQSNADLKLELDGLRHTTNELDRDIKFKADMINNLSVELARTKNDKKAASERVAELNSDNSGLRQELKKLVSAKGSLEKSIVRLSDEKNTIEKQLVGTESMIQSKINEIWEIKDSLDQSIQSTKIKPSANEVELPPIVVSSDGKTDANYSTAVAGIDGRVVSVNDESNFLIIDVGENSGLRLGDTLSVYRDSKYIARVEVIQLRKDIAAADIKDQWSQVKIGDAVR
jgi:chromosome segregation ATPase